LTQQKSLHPGKGARGRLLHFLGLSVQKRLVEWWNGGMVEWCKTIPYGPDSV